MIKISVCMPTFNGEKHIYDQIKCILLQLDENSEIIVSDDSSTDKTIDIIKSFKDKRIKILPFNTFYSPIFNIENALKYAKGEFIFLADQDDIWEKNKVKITLQYLQNYDLVISDCKIIDEEGEVISDSIFKILNSKQGFWKNWYKNSYLGCCMAFDRKILNKALPFPKNIAMHDIWIGLISEIFGKSYFLNEKLVLYRRHKENVSFTTEKSRYSVFFRIKYRLEFLFQIFKRIISEYLKNKYISK